jgi:Uma2 family endonuclease
MVEIASSSTTAVRPRRFTSDEVKAMLRAGVLHEDDPLELVDGQLVVMSPIHDPHIVCVNRLNTIFSRRLVTHEIEDVVVSVQNPVRIDEHNEPEPDVVLSTALNGAPRPGTVLLLLEVSGSTLDYDRDVKRPLYARAGIPEVWTVNLETQQIEVHRDPEGDAYRTRHLVGLDDTVRPDRPAAIGQVPVRDILGDLPEPKGDETEA